MDGNNIDSSGGFEPTGVQLYEIYYHHTDVLGCYNKDTLSINVIDPTNADAGTDLQECVDAGTIQFVGSPLEVSGRIMVFLLMVILPQLFRIR